MKRQLLLMLVGILLVGSPTVWAKKSTDRFDKKLWRKATVTWTELDLVHPRLQAFAQKEKLAVLFDGKFDFEYKIQGSLKALAIEEILDRSAQAAGSRAVLLGELIYIAPDDKANAAAALAQSVTDKIDDLDKDLQKAFEEEITLQWKIGGTAQEVLKPLLNEMPFSIIDADGKMVDFTFTTKGKLEKVRRLDAILGMLALSNLYVQLSDDGKKLTVAELPEKAPRMERTRKFFSDKSAEKRAKEATGWVLGLDAKVEGKSVTLVGTWANFRTLDRIDSLPKSMRPSALTFSLALKNSSVDSFAELIRTRLGKRVEIDKASIEKANIDLDEIKINCSGTGMTVSDLLKAALEPVGLTSDIKSDKIVIRAK